ncbi:MAG: 1,4-alpha-glucan branching protein GlgB [Sedimentisphaerales bacterium]|nr:1,4-alpha-glucan branching protein GlgB [Sedimentisphaerales bacterium]
MGHFTLLTDHDIYLFREGNHFRLYEKMGSHPVTVEGVEGVFFGVWAPNAEFVSVIGDFNGWNPQSHPMSVRWDGSGIWEVFIPGVGKGTKYKYHIRSNVNGYTVQKADPFAFHAETPPKTASIVWDLDYGWQDAGWMDRQAEYSRPDGPISVYEVHLGSWRRDPYHPERFLSYQQVAPMLAEYMHKMGFTHVEFLPVMEHPFYGSWGYQTVGYFAPTSRYGTCQDFMAMVDILHQNGIGVILDWVPSHFPTDEHGLGYFDGTHLFEHEDTRKGFHPDWKSSIFNYGRNEVQSFLISSAMYWIEKYHTDALRVDAVASMLYLDYSRKHDEWIPNVNGGRENLEAIAFLHKLNEWIHRDYPNVRTIAEESTSWPGVSRPVDTGGLGFDMKWNMGWMHDTLDYCGQDPVHRKYHQDSLTFSIWYAFSENFMLPLSHDEVVHGKGSLHDKMAGDEWQKIAMLRLLYGYMFAHPGKKLLFMGSEIGQRGEWNHDQSLDWDVLGDEANRTLQRWIEDLNSFYKNEPCLFEQDFAKEGFEWIDYHDADNSVISFLRWNRSHDRAVAVACNFTPVPRYEYRIGIPKAGFWKEVLNSDAYDYGGSGQGNMGGLKSMNESFYDKFPHTLMATLPPLGIVIFRLQDTRD